MADRANVDPPLLPGRDVMPDPLVTYQYAFQVQGKFVALVSEVRGLGMDRTAIEHKYIDRNFQPRTQMFPGRSKWEPLVLKRGLVTDLYFWEWYLQVEHGNYSEARKNCSVLMYKRDYTLAQKWDFIRAWPSKVTGPDLDSSGSEFAFEEITIVYESMTRSAR